ncbi:MAG: NAD(P)/FAD-dependent oxidoreductase [Thiotrichales bacterium]
MYINAPHPIDSVAIIGAGMAGLGCASALALEIPEVVLFESRSCPGGRMSGSLIDGERHDDACMPFTISDPLFRELVHSWRADGWIQPVCGWRGQVVDHQLVTLDEGPQRYVAMSDSGYLAQRLSDPLKLRLNTDIATIERGRSSFRVGNAQGRVLGEFDAVVLATPPDAAARLLAALDTHLLTAAASIPEAPLWVATLWFDLDLPVAYGEIQFPQSDRIERALKLRALPDRPRGETWVLHARREWSAANATLTQRQAATALGGEFLRNLKLKTRPNAAYARTWQVPTALLPPSAGCLLDDTLGIGICGDWCMNGTVEGAYLSGLLLAEQLLALRRPAMLRRASSA